MDKVAIFILASCILAISSCTGEKQEYPQKWSIYQIEDIFREGNMIIFYAGYDTRREVSHAQGKYIVPESKGFHFVYDYESGKMAHILKDSKNDHKHNLHFSPDGRFIGYTKISPSGRDPRFGVNDLCIFDLHRKKESKFASSKDTFGIIDNWNWTGDGAWIVFEKHNRGETEIFAKSADSRTTKLLGDYYGTSTESVPKIEGAKEGAVLLSSKGLEYCYPSKGVKRIILSDNNLMDFSVTSNENEVVLLFGNPKKKTNVRICIANLEHLELTEVRDSLPSYPYIIAISQSRITLNGYSKFAYYNPKDKKWIEIQGIYPTWKDQNTILYVSPDKQFLFELSINSGEQKAAISVHDLAKKIEK